MIKYGLKLGVVGIFVCLTATSPSLLNHTNASNKTTLVKGTTNLNDTINLTNETQDLTKTSDLEFLARISDAELKASDEVPPLYTLDAEESKASDEEPQLFTLNPEELKENDEKPTQPASEANMTQSFNVKQSNTESKRKSKGGHKHDESRKRRDVKKSAEVNNNNEQNESNATGGVKLKIYKQLNKQLNEEIWSANDDEILTKSEPDFLEKYIDGNVRRQRALRPRYCTKKPNESGGLIVTRNPDLKGAKSRRNTKTLADTNDYVQQNKDDTKQKRKHGKKRRETNKQRDDDVSADSKSNESEQGIMKSFKTRKQRDVGKEQRNKHFQKPNLLCPCTKELREMCGTDGATYANPCLLKCASKSNKKIQLKYEGPCEG